MIPTFNTHGRVFTSIIESSGYKYYNSMMVGAIDKSMPTVEAIYSYNSKGKIAKVGEIIDIPREITSSLSGILPLRSKSNLEKLFNSHNINIQVHYGTCTNPNDFNNFDSVIILKDVELTSYSLTELSAITPAKTVVQESANIVANDYYRVLNLNYIQSLTQNTIFGFDYVHSPSCLGINDNHSVWLVAYQSVNVRFKFTIDNGLTWVTNSSTFTPHQATANKAAMISIQNKVFWSIVNSSTLKIYTASIENILSNTTVIESEVFTKSTANIRDMASTNKFLWSAGESNGLSLLLKTNLENNQTEVIDDGDFHIAPAAALDVYDDNYVVIVYSDSPTYAIYSNNDVYIDGLGFGDSASLTDIRVLTKKHWVIAGNKGIYVTFDGGNTWQKTLVLTNDTKINFYDEITGYAMSGGIIYRTIDGGVSWSIVRKDTNNTPITISISPVECNNVFFASSGSILNGS